MPPDRGLSDKQKSSVKGKKNRLTYLLAANADGSTKLPPFIIGKAHKPRAFKNKTGTELGFYYRNNAKAWMTALLYQEWLLDWDRQLQRDHRKILLLQDNFAGHIVPDSLTNIHVENFEPNLTAHVQPDDQGIIRCFKAHYRSKFVDYAIDRYDRGVTPAEIYVINQLDAMRFANNAWDEVDMTTIRNCWRKAGILPDMDVAPVTQPALPISSLIHTTETHDTSVARSESLVRDALDDLEARGVLQPSNRMDIAEFLDPAMEAHDFFEATDEDIYEAVMDAKAARDGLDADDDDLQSNDTLAPTCAEALQAAMTLQKYVSTINEPIARKVEVVLESLGWATRTREMQGMKDTKLTDYFG